MSEAAPYITCCNCRATVRGISSCPWICLPIPFPLPFPIPFPISSCIAFPIPFPFEVTFPFPSFVPFAFPVAFSQPCLSSSPSPSPLWLPSLGHLHPRLGADGSAQFSSLSFSSIMSSQFSGLRAKLSPSLYCQQHGSSIFALRSSLPYQEKRSPVRWTFPELLVCGLQRSTCSPKVRGLSHLQFISKKHFHPGGMAPSEWTRSVRAVRDTPVADYSAPGVNTTRRVAYRPPIAVSQFLLALLVSYFKHTLWRCGQLWPYVRMGSLGTRLHRDCNTMGDTAKISPHVPSTLISRSLGRRWEDMILSGREDPRNCVHPNLGQSEWDSKLGKIECVFSLYDKMRWKWDAVFLPQGLPNIYPASLIPPPLPLYLCTPNVAP